MSAAWDEMAVVGRVARAHGNRGQVIVDPETDFPEERFRIGSVYHVRRGGSVEALAVTAVRFQHGRPILGLAGIDTMDAAESLAGAELRVPVESLRRLPEHSYYRHDLIGCAVQTADGRLIGQVTAVEGSPAESRLVVTGDGGEILVPLAREICVRIDLAARTIVVAPPEGLLDLNLPAAGDVGR